MIKNKIIITLHIKYVVLLVMFVLATTSFYVAVNIDNWKFPPQKNLEMLSNPKYSKAKNISVDVVGEIFKEHTKQMKEYVHEKKIERGELVPCSDMELCYYRSGYREKEWYE